MLKHFCNEAQSNWDILLQAVTYAYNTSVHSALQETPHFLLHGRDPRLPVDIALLEDQWDSGNLSRSTLQSYKELVVKQLRVAHEYAAEQLLAKQNKTIHQHSECLSELRHSYKLGQRVLLYNPVTRPGLRPKLVARWEGPYRIVKQHSNVSYSISDLDGEEARVHANRLKPFYANDTDVPLFIDTTL